MFADTACCCRILVLANAGIDASGTHEDLRVTDSSFGREVLSSAQSVLVSFIRNNCVPCKTIALALEELVFEMTTQADDGRRRPQQL